LGYFDPEPKTSKTDFFDYEEQLEEFRRGLKSSKLVAVAGLKRYLKTTR